MKKILIVTLLALTGISAFADEGMWMVNMIDKALEKKMKDAGCKLPANVIYDETSGSISDAIVSLDFECSGSFISEDGLVITNHHCAYADVYKLSTPKNNYLENGFWAHRRADEIPLPDRNFYVLRKVMDVSGEAIHLVDSLDLNGKLMGMRKLSALLEKKYGDDYPGMEVSLSKMYAGRKYYMMVYDVYHDVRLVAAPPVSIAAFGGEIDNWDWPQHKGDFAIYRVYTGKDGKNAKFSADNVPYHPKKVLKISTKGIKEGDFTMTLGYPGSTSRYISSFEVDGLAGTLYPIVSSMMKERMNIMWKWMNLDKEIRLKYSDTYFNMSNVQEVREWQSVCFRDDKVSRVFSTGREKHLSKGLLDSLERAYNATLAINEQIKYYQECIVHSGKLMKWGFLCSNKDTPEEKKIEYLKGMDLRVEREIFFLNMKEVRENIDSTFWGEYLTGIFREQGANTGLWIWSNSAMSGDNPASADGDDPLVKAYQSLKMINFNKEKSRIDKELAGNDGENLSALNRRYKQAVYDYNLANGIPQYPDANSTFRVSYGNVKSLDLKDAVHYNWQSISDGILEKEDPDDYNFLLKTDYANLLRGCDWGKWGDKSGNMSVNFITTNDITGGNSGSAVINARGELVGLAFDGNKEGLSCDVYFNPRANRCVCVDIRYVLWILDRYAGMTELLKEIL